MWMIFLFGSIVTGAVVGVLIAICMMVGVRMQLWAKRKKKEFEIENEVLENMKEEIKKQRKGEERV